jgi:hypothetical protein
MSGKLHDARDVNGAKGILDELDRHLVVSGEEDLALPVESDRTVLEAWLERGVRGHGLPFIDADQIDDARSDRSPHYEPGVGGRSEAHHEAACLSTAHGLDQTGYRRHADHQGIGECDVELAEGLRAPKGTGAHIAIRD